jgi:hypothetical protein
MLAGECDLFNLWERGRRGLTTPWGPPKLDPHKSLCAQWDPRPAFPVAGASRWDPLLPSAAAPNTFGEVWSCRPRLLGGAAAVQERLQSAYRGLGRVASSW